MLMATRNSVRSFPDLTRSDFASWWAAIQQRYLQGEVRAQRADADGQPGVLSALAEQFD